MNDESTGLQPWVLLYRLPVESRYWRPYIFTCMARDRAHALSCLAEFDDQAIFIQCSPGQEFPYQVCAYIRKDSPEQNDPELLNRVSREFDELIGYYSSAGPRPRFHWTVLYQFGADSPERVPRAFVCEAVSEAAARSVWRCIFPEDNFPGSKIVFVREGHQRYTAIAEYEASRTTDA